MVKTYIRDTAAGLETIRDPTIMVVDDTYYLTGTRPPTGRAKMPVCIFGLPRPLPA